MTAGCATVAVYHQPFWLNLAACNFSFFPKIKLKLRGCHVDTVEEIQHKAQMVLDALTE